MLDLQLHFNFFIRYAKVDVVASAPIVPFRETIVVPPKLDMANEIVENHNQVNILCMFSSNVFYKMFKIYLY